MQEGRLRTAIARWQPTRSLLPELSLLSKTPEKLRSIFGEVAAAVELADARRAFEHVLAAFAGSRALAGCRKRDLVESPWAFLAEPDSRADTLAFTDAFLAAASESTRVVRSTLAAFLLGYPESWGTFQHWCTGLKRTIIERDTVSLRPWAERAERYHILDVGGAGACASAWLSGGQGRAVFLEDTGLTGVVGEGRYARSVTAESLAMIQAGLSSNRLDGEQLQAALALALDEAGHVRFGLKRELADALLLPFDNRMPSTGLRDVVLSAVRRAIGDPRIRPAAWQGIGRVEAIARKLLAGQSIDVFFDLLASTAQREDMWAERREFWSGYLRSGAIDDAWVALGPSALLLARRVPDIQGTYGRYLGSSDASHSILLMRAGNAIVVEGSHNMMVRAWPAGSAEAPKLGEKSYNKYRIARRDAAPVEIRHWGDWQRSIMHALRRMG